MKFTDMKIKSKIILSFSIILILILIQTLITYSQNKQLYNQIDTLANHPLQVRIAVKELEKNILNITLKSNNIIYLNNYNNDDLKAVDLSLTDAENQFNILKQQYLGPIEDVNDAYEAYFNWKTANEENINLVLTGNIQKARINIFKGGSVDTYKESLLSKIEIIDTFAENKAEELYSSSTQIHNTIIINFIFIVSTTFIISLVLSMYLFNSVNKPLKKILNATRLYKNGKTDTRIEYLKNDEFGEVGDSFNSMTESINKNFDLINKIENISKDILKNNNPEKFYKILLESLIKNTSCQIAAIYLKDENNNVFNCVKSIGAENNARKSFNSNINEGEIGLALSTGNIQYIKDIPDDTAFVFNTVCGKFKPKEIIIMPIKYQKQIIGIISLANIKEFDSQTIELLNSCLKNINTRINEVIINEKMMNLNKLIEQKNSELEIQQSELIAQASELSQQNHELSAQKEQLSELSKLKSSFLSNVSHELRTPLNSVIALSGVLSRRLEDKIPEEEYSYLEIIERNGKNLLALINDVLDLSRIESGREEIEISEFNLNELIEDIIYSLSHIADKKNINLISKLQKDELIINSDSDKLRHIIQNIVDNAIKFTEKGSVEISTTKEDNMIEIRIKDTGIGIENNKLSTIFDEFRQIDYGTSRKYGGTGLGLAIAKKYTSILGGNISVKSEIDKGTEFIIRIPIKYNNLDSEIKKEEWFGNKCYIAKSMEIQNKNMSGKTILLIEDSEAVRIQIKDLMDELGYTLLIAEDGYEALERLNTNIPDAIILDIMMPGIDGFEVLERVRNNDLTENVPVLILTAKHITKQELSHLKKNHIHQLIQKGDINRIDLINAINSMTYIEEQVIKKDEKKKKNYIKDKPVVLIIEDNKDNMTTIKAILNDKYKILEAYDGKEGISIAADKLPDLILMDIALPDINGIEVFKIIRNNEKLRKIPVIAITASAMIHERDEILSYGFNGFVAKPIEENVLFKAINEELYGKQNN